MTVHIWRAVLAGILCLALIAPARGESLDTAGKQIVAGIVVVSVGIGVLITFLVLHYKGKKSTITGCVASGANGNTLANEKDRRVYALSGDPVGIKPGDRMTLQGKRKQSGKTPVFEAQSALKDFGACQP